MALGVALVVAWLGVRLAARQGRPFLTGPAEEPGPAGVDARLITGSLIFGVGIGLSGLAPGTALIAAGLFSADAAVLLAAILVGMILHEIPSRFRGDGPGGGARLSRG